MSKSTLGRGLSDLLGTRHDAGQATVTTPRVDGGLRILIEGTARAEEPGLPAPVVIAPKPATAKSAPPKALPSKTTAAVEAQMLAVLALVGADVALLGWSIWFASTQEHALGFLSMALCTLSVMIAALCGCAAVLMMQSGE